VLTVKSLYTEYAGERGASIKAAQDVSFEVPARLTLAPSWRGPVQRPHLRNGPDVFAHACRLGAEGIVSKRMGSPYRSGPCSTWIKVRNPASIAVQRERSEKSNK
jgi:hypothetical protein